VFGGQNILDELVQVDEIAIRCNSKCELCSEIGRSAFVASYGGSLNVMPKL